ncbi:MAG TPA: TetR/AcrR family transcriptional regulator [Polyangiaceae bacterium]
MNESGPPSRQQRAQETRDRLFLAACELFVANGYAGTTVDRIVSRAGVAKGTFFLHFKTKDAVATQLIENQTAAARHAHQRAHETGAGPVEAMVATVLALGKQAGASRMLSRAVLAATLESGEVAGDSSRLFQGIYDLILVDAREAKRRGLLSRSADPEQVSWSLIASYLGAALYFATNPEPIPLVEGLAPLVDANLAAAGATRRPRDGTGRRRPPARAPGRDEGRAAPSAPQPRRRPARGRREP